MTEQQSKAGRLTRTQLERLTWVVEAGGQVEIPRRSLRGWDALERRGLVTLQTQGSTMSLTGGAAGIRWTSYTVTITDAGRRAVAPPKDARAVAAVEAAKQTRGALRAAGIQVDY